MKIKARVRKLNLLLFMGALACAAVAMGLIASVTLQHRLPTRLELGLIVATALVGGSLLLITGDLVEARWEPGEPDATAPDREAALGEALRHLESLPDRESVKKY